MGVASQNSTLPSAITSFPVSLLLSSPGDVLSSELVERKHENTNNDQQKTRLEASKPSTYYLRSRFIIKICSSPSPNEALRCGALQKFCMICV